MIIIRQADVPWPAHSVNLAAKLKDMANISEPELSFQRKAVQDFHSHQADILQQVECDHPAALLTPDAHLHPYPSFCLALTSQNKHTTSFVTAITDDDSDAGDD